MVTLTLGIRGHGNCTGVCVYVYIEWKNGRMNGKARVNMTSYILEDTNSKRDKRYPDKRYQGIETLQLIYLIFYFTS